MSFLLPGREDKARGELEEAASEIEAMGYHRRDGELEDLRGKLEV